ncbi:MAG TPA: hypothetical protein VF790_09880 [Dissulfurispiraceae bacterium]
MERLKHRILCAALGASGGLSGLLLLSRCGGGPCASCFGCAGAAGGITVIALLSKLKKNKGESGNGVA